jgi:RNA polymerase sigma-70 factor (ECF subfamily)
MPDGPPDDQRSLVGRLYDEYGVSLYRYALMLLADASAAEDAVQQVFASLLKGSGLRMEKDLHYLRRAVRNECYSTMRRWQRTGRHQTGESESRLLESRIAEDAPDARLMLERAIRALAPEQREVVHLHVYEGMTFQEIADEAKESINTIASRYRYAVAKLRQMLE